MRSLFARMGDIIACPDCKIIRHERHNEVKVCDGCKQKEIEREARISKLSLEEFIREVVNGRAEVHENKDHDYALYEQYQEEMPYGTAKGRDGDPHQWVTEKIFEDYSHLMEEEEVIK